jgi:hypothetical protein
VCGWGARRRLQAQNLADLVGALGAASRQAEAQHQLRAALALYPTHPALGRLAARGAPAGPAAGRRAAQPVTP